MFVSFSISQSVSYLHIWCGWWGGVQVCPSLPLLVWSAALWSHTLCLGPDAITYSWGSWQHESPSRCRMSYDTQPTRKCIYFHTQWANAADSEVFLVVFFFLLLFDILSSTWKRLRGKIRKQLWQKVPLKCRAAPFSSLLILLWAVLV